MNISGKITTIRPCTIYIFRTNFDLSNRPSTSGLNGWLRADTTYAGNGTPGSGTGGNTSDGCALTTGDRILTSTSLSGGYTMTLGNQNMSDATGNVVLVRIALGSGQSVTSLSIGVAA